jgi:hypothetical protein
MDEVITSDKLNGDEEEGTDILKWVNKLLNPTTTTNAAELSEGEKAQLTSLLAQATLDDDAELSAIVERAMLDPDYARQILEGVVQE